MKKNIIFVIPAFNEEKNIKKVILDFKKIGKVLVVNDYSTDKTKSIASKYSNYIINNKYNKGYDKSLRIGLKYAVNKIKNSKVIFSIDGDGQHLSRDAKKFIKKINKNDVIIGKRNFYNRISEYFVGFFSKIFDNISGKSVWIFSGNCNIFSTDIPVLEKRLVIDDSTPALSSVIIRR